MSETQGTCRHTPGPWFAREHHAAGWQARVVTGEGLAIATCVAAPERSLTSAEANARLIAAAPELAHALRAIIFQVCQGKVLERDACITQAREALRKAGRIEDVS